MGKFAYVATGPDGQRVTGVEKASTREAIEVSLFHRNLRDIQVTERKSILQMEISGPRIKREEIMHISRQMAAFIRAGLPIVEAVHTIARESDNSSVRRLMEDVEEGLRAGDRFSDCLDRHPSVFADYYRGIVRSAELTGALDTVLTQLALYLERDMEARRKIKAATIYPAVVAVMSVVTVIVLATWVLPRFEEFFESLDASLPLPTRMMLAVTDFLTGWWWALALGALGVAGAVLAGLRTEQGQFVRDRVLLRVPAVGPAIQCALVERFCRVLASMVSAGVGLPEALRVATESVHNRVYVRALGHVSEAMLEGEGLAGPLARSGLFPNTASQMLRVGEETGTLDSQLEVTAEYYEGELDYKLKRLTALFEPLVIVVMGAIVGFVAIALISAMYGVFRQVEV